MVFELPGRSSGTQKERISLGGFILVRKAFATAFRIEPGIIIDHFIHYVELFHKQNWEEFGLVR